MLISVCMPLFNSANYLAAALDSVLDQSHPNVEIIVVDDGSTDASGAILQGYGPRVRAITQANKGAAAARNAAFRASSGDAILFMDCDDLIPPGHLSALAARLDGPNVIAMGQWDRFYSNPIEAKFPHRPTYRDAEGIQWLTSNGWEMMQSAMFLIPREHIERFGLWDETRSPIDDFEFYTRMIASSAGLRFASEAKVFYRSRISGSLSGKRSRVYCEGQLHSLLRGTAHLLLIEDNVYTRRACANVLQAFEYEHYPRHSDLRAKVRARVAELGGADLTPSGPPGFHKLRRFFGWKAARYAQRAAERLGINGVARQ